MKSNIIISFPLIAVMLAACVNVDPETGKTIPRGDQKYEFAIVKQQAEQLRDGMLKMDTLLLLGSPAKTSNGGDVWIYLPERPAVLIPSRALRLEFNSNTLISHGYSTILFGKQL